jgi:enamine deaminase RidA (YjgF/YER057c/UK114 family)
LLSNLGFISLQVGLAHRQTLPGAGVVAQDVADQAAVAAHQILVVVAIIWLEEGRVVVATTILNTHNAKFAWSMVTPSSAASTAMMKIMFQNRGTRLQLQQPRMVSTPIGTPILVRLTILQANSTS